MKKLKHLLLFAVLLCGTMATMAQVPEFTPITSWDGVTGQGWYQIKYTEIASAQTGTNFWLNSDVEFRQNASNFYPLKVNALDAEKVAKSFIYIDKDNYAIRAANGHWVQADVTAARTSTNIQNSFKTTNEKCYLNGFIPWDFGADEDPYIGKSGNTEYVIQLSKVDVDANYEVYTVSITGTSNATEIRDDAHLTCNAAENLGIARAYNGGTYFFTKGYTPTASDLDPTLLDGKVVRVVVDSTTKSIVVEYQDVAEGTLAAELHSATLDFYNFVEAAKVGYVGGYKQSSVDEAHAAILEAEDKVFAGTVTQTDISNLAAARSAFENSEKVVLEVNRTYMFVSALTSKAELKAMFSDGNLDLRWDTKHVGQNKFYWTLEATDGGYKVKNGDGTYIDGTGATGNNNTDEVLFMVENSADAGMAVFSPIQDVDAQWYINVNGSNSVHMKSNDTGSGIAICWNAGANSASAWYIVPIEERDIYEVTVVGEEQAYTTVVNYNGDKALSGGFFVVAQGTVPTADDFKILMNGYGNSDFNIVVTPATADANGLITISLAEGATKFSPSENDLYLIKNKKNNQFATHNPETVSGNNVILAVSADYDMTSFFRIGGSAEDGYTLRLANSESNYVYAINTNDANNNVGVKTVTGTPGEECKWLIISYDGGYNIIPKRGTNGWNIRGVGIGQWASNETKDNTWLIKSVGEFATENLNPESTVIGSYTGKSSDVADAAAAALSADFTQANYEAYWQALKHLVTPADGWYKIKNKALNKYMFSETTDNPKNITYVNDGGDNAKYYWYVTFGHNQATIMGTAGLSMARTSGNVGYASSGTTNYISPISLKPAANDNATWTEGYFLFPLVHSTNQSIFTRYNTGYNSTTNPIIAIGYNGTGTGNQYTFEAVEVNEDQIYTVDIYCPLENETPTVTYNVEGYTGNATVYNGGKYFLATAPNAADFTASVLSDANYVPFISVRGKTIRVVYGEKFVPTDGAAYVIQNTNDDRYAYRSPLLVVDGDSVLSASPDFRSLFKISGSLEAGYTLRLVYNEKQYVQWLNKNDNELNIVVRTVAGEPGENCLWDIWQQPALGGWNIMPRGGTNGWNIFNQSKDHSVGSWHGNEEANNIWHIIDYTDYLPKEELKAKINTQRTNCMRHLYSMNRLTDASQLSTNAQQSDEGPIANLLDYNTETYFHSCWSNGPAEDHYIQVDFSEAIGDFSFYFYNRLQNTATRPTHIVVSGSDTPGGTYAQIAEITDPMADLELYISHALEGGTYRSLRFTVMDNEGNLANNGHKYFSMAEFRVFGVPAALEAYRRAMMDIYPNLYDRANALDPNDENYATEVAAISAELADAFELQTTNVIPVTRASALSADKTYMIFNVAKDTNENNDLMGVMSSNGRQVLWESVKPSDFHTYDTKHLWKVVPNDDGSYKLHTYYIEEGGQVNAQGHVGTENVQIVNYANSPKKCGAGVSAWMEDEQTLVSCPSVTESHNLWAIHDGTNGWSGDANGFKSDTEAFAPFAFYEVTGYNATNWMALKDAKYFVKHEGKVGFPKKDNPDAAAAMAALKSLIAQDPNTVQEWSASVKTQLEAIKAVDEVQMPEDGKAYNIISKSKNGAMRYMNYTAAGYRLESYHDGDLIPETGLLICRKVGEDEKGNGRYAFVNMEGKYFIWRGKNAGNNSHKGYVDAFDATNANSNTVLTVEKMVPGSHVEGEKKDLFGYMAMKGNRGDGITPNYFVITSDGNYDQADAEFYNDNYSSALLFEEAVDPRTQVKVTTQLNDDDCCVATYSAPFPTRLPAGVKAFVAKEQSTSGSETLIVLEKLADGNKGQAIPAGVGVVLASETPGKTLSPATDLLPATTEGKEEVSNNLLVGTGKSGITVPVTTNAYILAKKTDGVGFYHLSTSGNRTLGAYRAYLDLGEESSDTRVVRISFGDLLTDIEDVEASVPAVDYPVYDLSGRRVSKPMRGGLYIKNGVKYIHK